MPGPSGLTDKYGLPFPIPDDNVDVPRDIAALAEKVEDTFMKWEPGMMMLWPGGVAPNGWYLCNGQAGVTVAANPGLNALFGNDGAGNVRMPDYRDMFLVQAGPTMPLGAQGGAASVALGISQMPYHSHRADGQALAGGTTDWRDRSQAHLHNASGDTGYFITYLTGSGVGMFNGGGEARPAATQTGVTDPADHLHAIFPNGGNQPHENRPPYKSVNYIIKGG